MSFKPGENQNWNCGPPVVNGCVGNSNQEIAAGAAGTPEPVPDQPVSWEIRWPFTLKHCESKVVAAFYSGDMASVWKATPTHCTVIAVPE
jgi:hypothetical protein